MHVDLISARELWLSCNARRLDFLLTQHGSIVVHGWLLLDLVIIAFIAAGIMIFVITIAHARFHDITFLFSKTSDLFLMLVVLVQLILMLAALHR